MANNKNFFHWFLEFPDIIVQGGFDCILGNPPYLGGQALSGTFGQSFCHYVKWKYAPAGLSDLVAYFVRRMFGLLRSNGFTAFITTNSIKDGDIRKDGLEQVISQGGVICMAVRAIRWPGRAKLLVSLLSLHNGPFKFIKYLEGHAVDSISAFLEAESDVSGPIKLKNQVPRVFTGYYWLGDGFLLTHEEADMIRGGDPRSAEVISLVINGDELNNEPDQFPQRSIINFRDWPQERAREYPLAFERIERLIRPFRATLNRERYRDLWWIFAEHRPGLTSSIEGLNRYFVAANTTKYLNFTAVPSDWIVSHPQNVLATDRWDFFAVVQSTIHEVWARRYSGNLGLTLRYSPSKCFETFAFPEGQWQAPNPALAAIGEQYHEHRRALMLRLWLGLTDIYNLFHNPEVSSEWRVANSDKNKDKAFEKLEKHLAQQNNGCTVDEAITGILELRRLHMELDTAVLNAYGWGGGIASSEIASSEIGSRGRPSIPPTSLLATSLIPSSSPTSLLATSLPPSSPPLASPPPLTIRHSPLASPTPLALHHNFYEIETLPENDRVRYTISPDARKEVLKRLLALNHQRAAQEAATVSPTSKNAKRKPQDASLFDDDVREP
jgi:hypothetical protein